jgi:hypothetical protein
MPRFRWLTIRGWDASKKNATNRGINPPVPPGKTSRGQSLPPSSISFALALPAIASAALRSLHSACVFSVFAKGKRAQGPRVTDLERRKPTRSRSPGAL